jgi:hypothetical protein
VTGQEPEQQFSAELVGGKQRSPVWAGVLICAMICGTIVAVTWLLTK